MSKFKYGKKDALIDYLLDGNKVTRLEALLLFGVQNFTAFISNFRKEGYLIKKDKILFVKALVRVNKQIKVEVPKNLPIKEIEIYEYRISK